MYGKACFLMGPGQQTEARIHESKRDHRRHGAQRARGGRLQQQYYCERRGRQDVCRHDRPGGGPHRPAGRGRAGPAALRATRSGEGQQGQQDQDHARAGRHPAESRAGDDRHPAVHLEPEDRGGGRPGRQPGGRGRRPPDGGGRDGLHLRVGDRRGADHRQVPDVLPDRVEGQRAGTAGRQLHREQPEPEGTDDRR